MREGGWYETHNNYKISWNQVSVRNQVQARKLTTRSHVQVGADLSINVAEQQALVCLRCYGCRLFSIHTDAMVTERSFLLLCTCTVLMVTASRFGFTWFILVDLSPFPVSPAPGRSQNHPCDHPPQPFVTLPKRDRVLLSVGLQNNSPFHSEIFSTCWSAPWLKQ